MPQTQTQDLTADERRALRTLAVMLEDEIDGLLRDGDFGDDIFDAGLLQFDDPHAQLTRSGEALVDTAEAQGLADRCTAFALMLHYLQGPTDSTRAAVQAARESGLLEDHRGELRLTERGIETICAELEACGARDEL